MADSQEYSYVLGALATAHGENYERLPKKTKVYVLYFLGLAIDVADHGEDLRAYWDSVVWNPSDRLPFGFNFGNLEGDELERMVRHQHTLIAAQILND